MKHQSRIPPSPHDDAVYILAQIRDHNRRAANTTHWWLAAITFLLFVLAFPFLFLLAMMVMGAGVAAG